MVPSAVRTKSSRDGASGFGSGADFAEDFGGDIGNLCDFHGSSVAGGVSQKIDDNLGGVGVGAWFMPRRLFAAFVAGRRSESIKTTLAA